MLTTQDLPRPAPALDLEFWRLVVDLLIALLIGVENVSRLRWWSLRRGRAHSRTLRLVGGTCPWWRDQHVPPCCRGCGAAQTADRCPPTTRRPALALRLVARRVGHLRCCTSVCCYMLPESRPLPTPPPTLPDIGLLRPNAAPHAAPTAHARALQQLASSAAILLKNAVKTHW